MLCAPVIHATAIAVTKGWQLNIIDVICDYMVDNI